VTNKRIGVRITDGLIVAHPTDCRHMAVLIKLLRYM